MCLCHLNTGEHVTVNVSDYLKISKHPLASYLDEYPTPPLSIEFSISSRASSFTGRFPKSKSLSFLNNLFHS